MPAPLQWHEIPAGTPERECKFCRAEIYWIDYTKRDGTEGRLPINCDLDGAAVPSARETGRGISHFQNCPGADQARKR